MCLCWKGGWGGRWVWMGVGCPCPPIRNDIVTPRQLFLVKSMALYSPTKYWRLFSLRYEIVFSSVSMSTLSHIYAVESAHWESCAFSYLRRFSEKKLKLIVGRHWSHFNISYTPYYLLEWSRIRVKFQKMIYSSLLHKCTKFDGFLASRGLNMKHKPCQQHYRLPMAIKKSP